MYVVVDFSALSSSTSVVLSAALCCTSTKRSRIRKPVLRRCAPVNTFSSDAARIGDARIVSVLGAVIGAMLEVVSGSAILAEVHWPGHDVSALGCLLTPGPPASASQGQVSQVAPATPSESDPTSCDALDGTLLFCTELAYTCGYRKRAA